jgi:hypothetical protein
MAPGDCYASGMRTRPPSIRSVRGLLTAVAAAALLAAAPAQSPALRILAPADGATVQGPDLTVRLEVEGVELGGRSRNGAYALMTLDELPPVKSYSPRFTFRGVDTGEHRLQVELRRAEGGAFDPPVVATAEFRIADSGSS